MKQKKKRRILPWLLVALTCIGVLVGVIMAKYSLVWDKEFGIRFVPNGHTNVLTTNLGSYLSDDTLHVVFGYSDDYKDALEDVEKTHVGATEDDLVYMYYVEDTKTTYFLCEEDIYFNPDSSDMFAGESQILSITYENANTTLVKDMSGMYQSCVGLTELDLTCFDTKRLEDSEGMFQGCESLAVVYAKPSFVTDAVTSSENMFTGCYNLVGGEGTRVYPVGSTETEQALDKTNAKIDGWNSTQGFFTEKIAINAFFRSNILKPTEENASYTVYGTKGWFTIANGLDTKTYASDEMEYEVTYFVLQGDEWVEYETTKGSFKANTYEKDMYQLQPIRVDGTTYDDIKVAAKNVSGLGEVIEAEIHFEYKKAESTYRYENGIIYVAVSTNDSEGTFVADYVAGISPDNADPNKLFTDATIGPANFEIKLNKHTKYEFCFFVTGSDLLSRLNQDSSNLNAYVEIRKK